MASRRASRMLNDSYQSGKNRMEIPPPPSYVRLLGKYFKLLLTCEALLIPIIQNSTLFLCPSLLLYFFI
jgi:hypothetical protein